MKKKTPQQIIKAKIEAAAIREIKGIDQRIESILQSSILSLMGLEKRHYDEYQIDHCNSRNSVLIDAFRNIAIKKAEKIAKAVDFKKADLAPFENAFRIEYSNHLNREIKSLAASRAKEDAKVFIDSIEVDINEYLETEP